MSAEITIKINGENQVCSNLIKLPELLDKLGINARLIAIEYNGEILHRQFWPETFIQEGDKLEIVTIVGGG
jgi:sulfur carrier protein